MNTFHRPPPGLDSHYLEAFNFPSSATVNSVQPNGFYDPGAPHQFKPNICLEPKSSIPPTSELTTLSLKAPLCPLCKGQKYGFTAYFHNQKIFPEPPHDLLRLVEKSYFLKNRLKSLLVTYVMRGLEHDGLQEAEREVLKWSQSVEELLSEVVASFAGYEMGLRPLEEVRNWTIEITRRIRESIAGKQKLDMPKGRLLTLLLEFRKLWEGVWKANGWKEHVLS